MGSPQEGSGLGLGKEYQQIQIGDTHGILPQSRDRTGCLSNSTDRFRKFFRIGRDRFEDIYSKESRSGLFHLNPLEPMYAELHPAGPMRHGKAQLEKVSPLCLRMTVSFRRLATCESFANLSDEFRIGLSRLHKFDKQFLKWFRMTY